MNRVVIPFQASFFMIFIVFAGPSFGAATADQLLLEGKRLFWSGDYKQAGKKIERAIAMGISSAEAHYFNGYCIDRIDRDKYPGNHLPDVTWERTERVSREFERAARIQPEYTGEIICLRPREKIMSEWSGLAEAYLLAGAIDKAKAAFAEAKKRGGMVPELYEFMHNMLVSCPEDAVLITGGDMDTFFPLYFQVVEGLRTDVTVLNLHLCQQPWFLRQVTGPLPWQKQPLRLLFSEKELKDPERLLARYEKPFDVSIPRPGCGGGDSITLGIVPAAQKGKPRILLSDLVLLSVLRENPDRPLCVAPTVKDRTLNYRIYMEGKPFDPLSRLEKRGLVEVVTLCPNEGAGWIDVNETLLTKTFLYGAIPDSDAIGACDWLVNEYISAFIHAASQMERLGQLERSRAMFGKLVGLMPGIRYLRDETMRAYLLGLAGEPIGK